MPATRLIDYFVEVVAEPADASQQSDGFERKVVTRIPPKDHEDFPLPDGVPYFCIPESVAFFEPTVFERKPTFFSFILTGGDGARAYGFALHLFEKCFTVESNWRPRVLCLISHHPFFSLFKEVVSWTYRGRFLKTKGSRVREKIAHASENCSWFLSPRYGSTRKQLNRPYVDASTRNSYPTWEDAEDNNLHSDTSGQYYRILSQLLRYAARPAPGKVLDIRIHEQDIFRYRVPRGKASHLDDYCFQMLFQCLSLRNVVYVVNCLLLEQRVLVHSSHQGLLTPICEALCTLLFPFMWEHVFIPFLPVELIEYLQAPVPYFIGLQTSSLATRVGAEMFASCVVVHLDKDKVVSPIISRVDGYPVDFALPRLPSGEVAGLLSMLENVIPNPVGCVPYTHRYEHSSPHSTVNEVELTFGEGPLGITFESTHLRLLAASNFEPVRQLGGSAVVKALPKLHDGFAGPAERSGMISAGSYLIGINGKSTMDLSFEETIDYLRTAGRPIRLRFLNAILPYENACEFAERLQALSLVSALQTVHENRLLSWVDTLRGAFAVMFASIFCDYEQYINVERRESCNSQYKLPGPDEYGRSRRRSSALALCVQFDYSAFCSAVPAHQRFLSEFTQTQSFAGFINGIVLGSSVACERGALELFNECAHLARESNNAGPAIMILFERDRSPTESTVLDLPSASGCRYTSRTNSGQHRAASHEKDIDSSSSLHHTSANSTGNSMPTESPLSFPPSAQGKMDSLQQTASKSPQQDELEE